MKINSVKNKLFPVMLGLALLLVNSSLVRAESESPAVRWNKMSETQKQESRDNYFKWKVMPETEKKTLQENYSRYKSLSPVEKERIVSNYRKFKSLPVEQQQSIRNRFAQFKKLPEGDRLRRIQKVREQHQTLLHRVLRRRHVHH